MSVKSQLTSKDFKLCLDNATFTDTVLRITKKQLLASKKVIPNYSWFTIDSVAVYVGQADVRDDFSLAGFAGDTFTKECENLFERIKPGGVVIIQVKGHNKQHLRVDWGTLAIRIVD